jgi:hypothetical protein
VKSALLILSLIGGLAVGVASESVDMTSFNSILNAAILVLMASLGWGAKTLITRGLAKMDSMDATMTKTNIVIVEMKTTSRLREEQLASLVSLSERVRKVEIWQAEQRGLQARLTKE